MAAARDFVEALVVNHRGVVGGVLARLQGLALDLAGDFGLVLLEGGVIQRADHGFVFARFISGPGEVSIEGGPGVVPQLAVEVVLVQPSGEHLGNGHLAKQRDLIGLVGRQFDPGVAGAGDATARRAREPVWAVEGQIDLGREVGAVEPLSHDPPTPRPEGGNPAVVLAALTRIGKAGEDALEILR